VNSAIVIKRLPKRARWPFAIAIAVAMNLALVTALGRMAQRGEMKRDIAATVVIDRIALPLPPPPESDEAETFAAGGPPQPTAAMPDLELAVPRHDEIAFTLPAATLDSVGAHFLPMPSMKPIAAASGDSSPLALEFDTPPDLVEPVAAERFYPRAARQRRIGGESVLRLRVSERGVVTAAEIISSTPPGVFDEAAKRLALSMHGKPALRRGRPVAAVCSKTIRWNPP
jgi:periplasmic protein TonB